MKIINASIEDLNLIVPLFDLYRQFYEQTPDLYSAEQFLSERINNKESVIFLALDEEKHSGMGFVQLYPAFTSVGMQRIWILNDLFVHEDYRKQGVAEALMQRSKDFTLETNAKGIVLETQATNTNAQRLYEKIGYEIEVDNFRYFLSLK